MESHRRFGVLECEFKMLFEILRPLVVVIIGIGPGEASVGAGIVRVDFPGLFKKIARRRIAFAGEFMPFVPAPHRVTFAGNLVRSFPDKPATPAPARVAANPPLRAADDPVILVTKAKIPSFRRAL